MISRPLRVAVVAPYPIRKYYPNKCHFTKAGSEHPASWIVNLVHALGRRSDVDLHVITIKSHLVEDTHFRDGTLDFHVLRGTRNSLQPLSLYEHDRRVLVKELDRVQPDVVESFGTEGPFSYAGVTSSFPCVIKVQGIITKNVRAMGFQPASYLWWRYFITQYIERITFRSCTDAIADNDFMAEFVRKINPNANIHYIPNLIAPVFFSIERDWTMARKNILYLGSLKVEKGTLDLVEAFGMLCSSGIQANLRLIGHGSPGIIGAVKDIAAKWQVEESVVLLGQKNHQEIAAEMNTAAILVHPSWADSSPNTVYESMIAGLPVIATNVGGIPYMIDNGETGYLVEPRRSEMLADRMKMLLEDIREQQRIGTVAMQKMRVRFDEDRVVNDILSVYYSMLG